MIALLSFCAIAASMLTALIVSLVDGHIPWVGEGQLMSERDRK